MSEENDKPDAIQEALQQGQAAIVFDPNGDYSLYIPSEVRDEANADKPTSEGMHLMALCISLLNSQSLQDLALLRLKAMAAAEERGMH